MTSGLRATLLGDVRFEHAGEEVRPGSRKGTALLAYLCLAGSGVRRDGLAELLWGPGRSANLRQELYALRKLSGAAEWLEESGDTVSVRADTDVAALERAGQGAELPTAVIAGKRLLPGLNVVDAPAFRDWLDLERREVGRRAARALRAAAERCEHDGRFREAIDLVSTALRTDPLDEALHRAAIRLAFRAGDPVEAQARFEQCRDTLRRELGLEPAAETVALIEAVRGGGQLPFDVAMVTLDPESERLAQALAIAEGTLDVEGLGKVIEREPLQVAADLARLERGGWLDHHLRLTPQLATRLLASAPVGVTRLLHGRVAQVLAEAGGSPPAAIAEHLLRADRPVAAAPLLLRAAQDHIDRSDPAEAVPLLLRASWAAWENQTTRLEACLLLEGCASQLGDEALQDAALSMSESIAWELQRDVDLAEVRMRRSRFMLRRGRVGEGLERALEALEIANRLGDERLMARARNAVGGAQFYAGDLDGAESSFTANVTTTDPIERYRARNNLGSIAGIRGRPDDALVHLEEALTLARAGGQLGDVIGTLNNLAATADRLGDYRKAVRYFRESLTLARRSGSIGVEGQILVNLSVVYSRLGELGPAWNTACEVEDIAEQITDVRLGMRAREQKAEVAYICGHDELAMAEYRAATQSSVELGDERKAAELAAQRAVVAARAAPELVGAASDAIGLLAKAGLTDVAPWLWLELSLSASDPVAAASWLNRAKAPGSVSPHLRLVTALAELRTGMLDAASPTHLEKAGKAHDLLFGLEPGTGLVDTMTCVQTPQILLLGALWSDSRSDPGGQQATEVLGRVRAALDEQAAGLPRSLADSLAARPSTWLTPLRASSLTLV